MKTPIEFYVSGVPKPAGSKRGFYIAKIKRVIITDANPNSKDWKMDVKHEAKQHYNGDLWDCPIRLQLCFYQLRPKSHYRSGANSHLLKDSAPLFPTGKPDVLKLARGVEDAITGIIWVDDSQIVSETLTKQYSDKPGVLVKISEHVE